MMKYIYTCIMNDYRGIYPDNLYMDDFKYICFTDGKCKLSEPWINVNVYDCFPEVSHIDNPKILSSYFKVNTKKYFKNGDYVFWWDCHLKIDNNIILDSLNKLKNGVSYNLHLHPFRITYCDEMIWMYHNGLIDKNEIVEKTLKMKKNGYDFNSHICAITANLSKTINDKSKKIDDLWWIKYEQFECYAKRDQLPMGETLMEIDLSDVNFYGRGLMQHISDPDTKYSDNSNKKYRPSWSEISEMQSFLTDTTRCPLVSQLIMSKPL